MKELVIENLSKSYGVKQLIDDVTLSIRTGDKIGLIGPNGTGKSSFLKVIAGIDNYDTGTITRPKDYLVAYLDQHPELDPDLSILDTVFQSKAKVIQLVHQYEQLNRQLELQPENTQLQTSFLTLTDQMNHENAWDAEVRAKTILSQLGLNDLNRLVGQCSGGEQKRIGIAQVLIENPDLLILDEPTNHLDVASVQWLEKYLASFQGALILVTHDRYFLSNVVNKIIELRFGKMTSYEGNYETYLTKRAELAVINQKMNQKEDQLYKQELAWMRKGAKARTTKQQARIDRFEEVKTSIEHRNQASDEIEFNFNQQRIGKQIIELDDISIEINQQKVIEHFTKAFVKGDRIGIIGENGVGKTTFLNTLAGLHPITSGSYHIGQTVQIAYYQQLDQDLPGDMRVLAYLTQVADNFKRPDGSTASASQMLEQFNFPRETHGTAIHNLSGGERRRLYLLSLLIQEPNVLILDEPTNDLDIDTLTVLEDYILNFQGVVFAVSHDRYFLDKTVDQLLELQGDGNYEYVWGNFSDYLDRKSDIESSAAKANTVVVKEEKPAKANEKAKRMTYFEKQEWACIQTDIEKVETKIAKIQDEMSHITSDAAKLIELNEALEKEDDTLLHLYERYEYLSELNE
ncbi:ABC-F family ATP-binding cassette domain-containing protein [Fundicoccus culcitae]|uniref:ABC-F family ATP-binding cassette domain-containing protein n=1 Tax=Fundicoccus culcitae TaxID=2969821 RepID=A0ABY5P6P1_9LACT|nr:ABC-F family ATP-binding cassette domain-containing protein [Fundicoccus culcitae]UUX34403.1 ABC-F family ATP-binding cassette domain-containing protein [Fundicoccus culcitae]